MQITRKDEASFIEIQLHQYRQKQGESIHPYRLKVDEKLQSSLCTTVFVICGVSDAIDIVGRISSRKMYAQVMKLLL